MDGPKTPSSAAGASLTAPLDAAAPTGGVTLTLEVLQKVSGTMYATATVTDIPGGAGRGRIRGQSRRGAPRGRERQRRRTRGEASGAGEGVPVSGGTRRGRFCRSAGSTGRCGKQTPRRPAARATRPSRSAWARRPTTRQKRIGTCSPVRIPSATREGAPYRPIFTSAPWQGAIPQRVRTRLARSPRQLELRRAPARN